MTVGDLMNTEVITVDPGLTLRDLVLLFTQHHISGAPVVDGSRLVGVVSASDVLSFLADLPGVPTERTDFLEEGEVLPPGEWEEGDESAAAYFTDAWDDVGADLGERLAHPAAPEWDVLAEHTVAEAMTRTLATLSPDSSIRTAARYFVKRQIHRVLVLENGSLAGLLTTTDLVRAVADGTLAPVPAHR